MRRHLVRSSSLAMALATLLGASGCYHYVAEPVTPIPQGTPVRIRLVTPESFELPSITAHNIGTVTAEMIREDDGEVVVSTRWLDAVTGEGFDGESWTFRIERANVAALQIRELSRWRTAALFVGGAVATYLGWHVLGGGGSEPGSDNGTVPR